MRIAREYQVEKVVSDDPSRTISNLFLDVEEKRLIATDGHCMAVVPVSDLDASPGPCPTDSSGLVSPKAIANARKVTPKALGDSALSANGVHTFVDGSTMPRPQDGKFPPWKQLLPEHKENDQGTITIGLNPELLMRLCGAIGIAKGKPANVTIRLPEVSGLSVRARLALKKMARETVIDPFVVKGVDGAVGVLMPCRR